MKKTPRVLAAAINIVSWRGRAVLSVGIAQYFLIFVPPPKAGALFACSKKWLLKIKVNMLNDGHRYREDEENDKEVLSNDFMDNCCI
jgi:hypothetical protein